MTTDQGATASASSPPAAGSKALLQLQAGEITLEQYLDDRVERAVRDLRPFLSEERLEDVREVLRSQAVEHPVLVQLVREATGHEVTPR